MNWIDYLNLEQKRGRYAIDNMILTAQTLSTAMPHLNHFINTSLYLNYMDFLTDARTRRRVAYKGLTAKDVELFLNHMMND